ASNLAMEPVPRLVAVAVPVAPGIGEEVAVARGMEAEPCVGLGLLERLLQGIVGLRADVDRAAGVMLAVSRRRADGEDLFERLPAGELVADDLALSIEAAKRRHEVQVHTGMRRRGLHPAPRARRGRRK